MTILIWFPLLVWFPLLFLEKKTLNWRNFWYYVGVQIFPWSSAQLAEYNTNFHYTTEIICTGSKYLRFCFSNIIQRKQRVGINMYCCFVVGKKEEVNHKPTATKTWSAKCPYVKIQLERGLERIKKKGTTGEEIGNKGDNVNWSP